jgi:D-alanine-D-alanine ligase-like ATP-grasp enzyme
MKISPKRLSGLQQELAHVCPASLLRLDDIELYGGPTPHAPVPAIQLTVEATTKPSAPSDDLRALRQAFPSIFDGTDASTEGEGTPSAIVAAIARLAAGLTGEALGMELGSGPAWKKGPKASAWIELFEPGVGILGVRAALAAAASALTGEGSPAQRSRIVLEHRNTPAAAARPNFESGILIAAAKRRNLPARRLCDDHAIWQFGWGSCADHIWVTSSNRDGLFAHRISRNKQLGKRLITELGLPTPEWQVIGPGDDPERAAQAVGWPCVVKPLSSGGGKGVRSGLRTVAELQEAIVAARTYDTHVLIEAHEHGEDYRLMVIDGQLVAAVRRDIPFVLGDGRSTVGQLVAAINRTREGPERMVGYLSPIPVDASLNGTLAAQGVALETVLEKDRRILVRSNANRSTGGTAVNVLHDVHPQIRRMAEQLAGAFGFRATGIDYITQDISRRHGDIGGAFLEVNTTPGFRVLLAGGHGEDELGSLILGNAPARVPIILVLASAGELASIGELLSARLPASTALVLADSAQIGAIRLPNRRLDAQERLRSVLLYPRVEAVIVAWSQDDLADCGLPDGALARTIIVGKPPARAWAQILRRGSAEFVQVERPEQAVERLLAAGSPATAQP